MPPSSPPNSKPSSQRIMMERTSSVKKTCEQCRRRRRICNSQRPCSHCIDANQDCVYSVVSDHARSVFSTQAARRLSSGSACETCRRRKTKCDGGSPCSFCATNNIDCVNHSERRHKRPPTEAIDRIEDRLQRIERLMTAFSPSPLSQSSQDETSHRVRPHRHSVQGIDVAKEQTDTRRRGSPYSPRFGSLSPPPSTPPISITRPSSSHATIAHSMLNLSLSPSSSSTCSIPPLPLSSASTPSPGVWPISPPPSGGKRSGEKEPSCQHTNNIENNNNSNNDWKTIPSVTDQLSERTFATHSVDYTVTRYPIYPLTPPSSHSRPMSPPHL